MRATFPLACAILATACAVSLSATTQPAEAAKPQFSGKMADGTRIDFDRFPAMKMTFSNGWTVTKLTPGRDRAGRRFSGIGMAGDKNLVITGYTAADNVSVTVTVGIGKGATNESVTLEKTKADKK
jgi:hypothetical protein